MTLPTLPLPPPPEPSAEQHRAIARLVKRTQIHLDMLSHISAFRAGDPCRRQAEALARLKTPRQSNAVGVFGRRGSGKTTVLVQALENVDGAQKDNRRGGRWCVLTSPLDLSYAPSEFPFGLTAMHWLYEVMQEQSTSSKAATDAFDNASQSYFRGAVGFNSLVRDLSVTPKHYARASAEEIRRRRSLWRDVRAWLDAEAYARDVKGFVFGIDDLDLAPANAHHSLVWSLLDELHQDRLVFLLAADLPRLERRLAEEDAIGRRMLVSSGVADLDDQTASDLVYKVLPQVDRCELTPWPAKARLDFPPGGTDDREDLDDGRLRFIRVMVEMLGLSPVIQAHLPHLLPEWARGLENLRRELSQRLRDRKSEASVDRDMEELELLGFLAESSFDFKLARKLRERELGDWAPTWRWPAEGRQGDAAWKVLCTQARNDEPLTDLLPDPDHTVLPLGLERVRWAEVLVDVALAKKRLGPSSLVERVALLRRRRDDCGVSIRRTWDQLSELVDDGPVCLGPALAWTDWRQQDASIDRGVYEVGVGAILGLVLRDRSPWPVQLEERLMVTRQQLVFGLPSSLSDAFLDERHGGLATELLPWRVRPLIRFLDRLGELPWAGIAKADPQTGPVSHARAAAAFVYSSLRDLVIPTFSAGKTTADSPAWPVGEALTGFIDAFSTRSEQQLSRLTVDSIRRAFLPVMTLADADRAILDELLAGADGQPDADRAIALPAHAALRSFLNAPYFLGLDPRLEGVSTG